LFYDEEWLRKDILFTQIKAFFMKWFTRSMGNSLNWSAKLKGCSEVIGYGNLGEKLIIPLGAQYSTVVAYSTRYQPTRR